MEQAELELDQGEFRNGRQVVYIAEYIFGETFVEKIPKVTLIMKGAEDQNKHASSRNTFICGGQETASLKRLKQFLNGWGYTEKIVLANLAKILDTLVNVTMECDVRKVERGGKIYFNFYPIARANTKATEGEIDTSEAPF